MQFSSETSIYQRLKLILMEYVPITKDAFHVYLGTGSLLFVVAVLRWPLTSFLSLLPGLFLSLAMEAIDLWDDSRTLGHLRWGASVHDVVNTNLLPLVIVLLARARRLQPVKERG